MAKLAYLLAATLAFVVAGCEHNNPDYCNGHTADFCPDDGHPSEPMGCTSNGDCKSASAPLCDLAGDKTCVQCLVPGENTTECTDATHAICENRACRGCTAHSECASQLCRPDGSCAPEDSIAYLAGAGDGGTDNATCGKATPCTRFMKALDTGKSNLKFHGTIDDAANINRSVDIYADPGAKLTRSTNGTILTVNNTATVTINDLSITKAKNTNDNCIATTGTSTLTLNRVTVSEAIANGILCGGKSLTVNHSTIFKNPQFGINCTSGALIVNASKIYKNDSGGIQAMNTTFDIINTYVVHNGTSTSMYGGLNLAPPSASTNRFEFNTVADNDIGDTALRAAGVVCDIQDYVAPNNLISHNKVGGDPNKGNSNFIGRCGYGDSAVTSSNTDYKYVNDSNDPYDYSIQAGSLAIDKATTASTVNVDYKGTSRPQGDVKDLGADEYKP